MRSGLNSEKKGLKADNNIEHTNPQGKHTRNTNAGISITDLSTMMQHRRSQIVTWSKTYKQHTSFKCNLKPGKLVDVILSPRIYRKSLFQTLPLEFDVAN